MSLRRNMLFSFKNIKQYLLNPEMVDLSGWIYPATTGGSGIHNMSGGRIYIEQITWSNPAITVTQNITLLAGKQYRLEYSLQHGGSGFAPAIRISSGGTDLVSLPLTANTTNTGTHTFTAINSLTYTLQAGRGLAGGTSLGEYMYFDYIRLFDA